MRGHAATTTVKTNTIVGRFFEKVLYLWQYTLVGVMAVQIIAWLAAAIIGNTTVIAIVGITSMVIVLIMSIPLLWIAYHNMKTVRLAFSMSYLLFTMGCLLFIYRWQTDTLDRQLIQLVLLASFIFGTVSAVRELRTYMHRSVEAGKTEEIFGYYLDLGMVLVTVGTILLSLVGRPIMEFTGVFWAPVSIVTGQTMFIILFTHRWYSRSVTRWPLIALTCSLAVNLVTFALYSYSIVAHVNYTNTLMLLMSLNAPIFLAIFSSRFAWMSRDQDTLPRGSTQWMLLILILVATTTTVVPFLLIPDHYYNWWSFSPLAIASLMLIRLISLTGARDRSRERLNALITQVELRSNHDLVTDLLNRRGVEAWLTNHFQTKRVDIGLIFLKINGIKSINDMSGYLSGDQALYHLGQRLVSAIPETDLVGRMDGNIFVMALTQANDIGSVEAFARKAIDLVTKPIVFNERINSYLGANAYVVLANEQDAVSELLSIADAAVNQLFTQEDSSIVKMHTRMLSDVVNEFSDIQRLRTALDQNEFELFYQPVIDLQRNRPTGFEALARWSTSTLSPAYFIPQIENAGLADMFGRWVLKEATTFAAQNETDIAINISPRHLHNPSFYADVCHAVEDSGCPADRIVLEITERTSIQNEEALTQTLALIRQLGIRIAVDDFGTGEFSLLQLSKLPLDILKIDRSFVLGITSQRGDKAMVESLIHIANGLGLAMIAEGIENREVAEVLTDLLCEEAQGYLWAKPMNATQAAIWWDTNKHRSVVV